MNSTPRDNLWETHWPTKYGFTLTLNCGLFCGFFIPLVLADGDEKIFSDIVYSVPIT